MYLITEEASKKLVIRLLYDANEGIFNAWSFNLTVFSLAARRPQVWILILFHIILWGFWNYKDCDDYANPGQHLPNCISTREFLLQEFAPPAMRDIAPLVTVCTFLIMNNLRNSYQNYKEIYLSCHRIQVAAKDVACYMRAAFRDPEARWEVVRYMVASQQILYWEVVLREAEWHGHTSDDPPELHPGAWDGQITKENLVKNNLLSEKECSIVGSFQGNKHTLLVTWAMTALRTEFASPPSESPCGTPQVLITSPEDQANFITTCSEYMCRQRIQMARLNQLILFPLPWAYYHLIHMMVYFILLILCYAFVNLNISGSESHISIIIYPWLVFLYVGVIELSGQLQHPFGNGLLALNLNGYLDEHYQVVLSQCMEEASQERRSCSVYGKCGSSDDNLAKDDGLSKLLFGTHIDHADQFGPDQELASSRLALSSPGICAPSTRGENQC